MWPQRSECVATSVRAFVQSESPDDSSGETVVLSINGSDSPQAFEAFGRGSVRTLIANNADSETEGEIFIGTKIAAANVTITGQTHDIVASNIVSITNGHSDPDNTSVPVGNVTFAAFTFAVSNKALTVTESTPVTLRELSIFLNAQNVEIDPTSISIYNALNPSSIKACSASDSTGSITITCTNLESSVIGTTIDQGDTVTLALRGIILNASTGGSTSTLQASLQQLGSRTVTGTVEWEDSETTFGWVDIEETSVSSTLYLSN